MKDKFKIVVDEEFGYRRVDPTPDYKEINDFYDKEYYKMVKDGTGKPDQLLKFMGKDVGAAEKERSWLRGSLYSDVQHVLNKFSPGKSILDVGCGTGELMTYLKESGFEVHGVEPSGDAAQVAKEKSLCVSNMTVEEFGKHNNKFDAITIINVLEHVPSPSDVIENLKGMLNKDGILCVVVPNDFSDIQIDTKRALSKENDWWVSIPDHLNYFNFKSLCAFLDKMGFDVCYKQGDFPMELFLLMGYDYIEDKKLGKECHERRVGLEKSLSPNLRRAMYRALSEVGVSRICFVVGKLR